MKKIFIITILFIFCLIIPLITIFSCSDDPTINNNLNIPSAINIKEQVLIDTVIFCFGNIINSDSKFDYNYIKFSSGDIWVKGSIITNDTIAANSVFYPRDWAMSQYGPILIGLDTHDISLGKIWSISLDYKSKTIVFDYNDADKIYVNYSLKMSDVCVIQNLN